MIRLPCNRGRKVLARLFTDVSVQSGTGGGELQLKSTWIGRTFSNTMWHDDRGANAVFVRQLVVVEGSQ